MSGHYSDEFEDPVGIEYDDESNIVAIIPMWIEKVDPPSHIPPSTPLAPNPK